MTGGGENYSIKINLIVYSGDVGFTDVCRITPVFNMLKYFLGRWWGCSTHGIEDKV